MSIPTFVALLSVLDSLLLFGLACVALACSFLPTSFFLIIGVDLFVSFGVVVLDSSTLLSLSFSFLGAQGEFSTLSVLFIHRRTVNV